MSSSTGPQVEVQPERYQVHRRTEDLPIDADWNKPQWQRVQPLELSYYMGEEPAHRPRTQAKVLYDDDNLFLIFRVEDRYVRAVAQKYNDMVCFDSCVEFFFTPGPDVGVGYFNLEVNCGGTILLHGGQVTVPYDDNARAIDVSEIEKIEVAHTMPRLVDPEIAEPTTWSVELRVPLDMLGRHIPVVRPAPGVVWRANFYKCGDETSHPHWLTWSRVVHPKPNFHLPEYFGILEFR